jgi:plastocyanin
MRKKTVFLSLVVIVASAPLYAGSIKGTVTSTGMSDNANAVVYIGKIGGKTFPAPQEPVVLDQRGKEFVPFVLPVLVGTQVDFLNSDPFAHNVFTPDGCAESFDLGSWPSGEIRSYTFKKPCEAVVLCNVHAEMVAYVLALETPYSAVTDAAGVYTIPDVPDGEYTVVVWHERLDKASKRVTVNGETQADFTLK